MRRVMIATPAYDGRVDIHFADSLVASVKACAGQDIDLAPVYWPGEAILFHARNELFQMAIENALDDIVWIDSDQGWTGVDLIRLLDYKVDVVGAAVRKKTLENELYNVRANSPNMPVDIQTGLLIPEGLGTGMLRLSKKAMWALWQVAEPYEKDGRTLRLVFENVITAGRLMSEDFILCEKLKGLGFKIHLDPTMTVAHFGGTEFKGDFSAYLKGLQSKVA